MLLERTSPMVRTALIRYRQEAMQGELDRANSSLRDEIRLQIESGTEFDVIALAMLRAELLYLEDRQADAVEQFTFFIQPRLDRLDLATRLAVEQNYIDLRMRPFGPDTARAVSDFYHLYDRKRIADVEWADNHSLVDALMAIEGNDHRKALGALWNEAIRTYRLGCWSVHREAMRRLGHEWLRIGKSADAAYCAILAWDRVLIEEVADDLVRRMDLRVLEEVIDRILAVGNLRKQFCIACEFLARVHDAVPDSRLVAVAEWLLRRCSIQDDRQGTSGPLYLSWRALQSIAHRLPIDPARRAVLHAVSHPYWTGADPGSAFSWTVREQMIETINRLVPRLSIQELEPLAHHVLPLALDRMQPTDYDDALNLLCHIAERGGADVRQLIGDRLFDPSRPRYHILGQVAHIFHREYLPAAQLDQLPAQVARNIRLQVQKRSRGQTFESVPGAVFQITREVGDEFIQTIVTGMMDFYAVVRHRREIRSESIVEMVQAAVEMLADHNNEISNRASLVRGLMELADVFDGPTTARAFDELERIAHGEIGGEAVARSDPLDPIRFKSTTKDDLRGIALVACARVGSNNPDIYRGRVEDMLEEALSAPQVEVRRGAFAAFGVFPVRSEASLLAVLLGTRDPDPGGAVAAFAALARKQELTLNRNHWRLLLYSSRLASRATSSNLRRHAAATLARLIHRAPQGTIRSDASEILGILASDICESVREAAMLRRSEA